MAKNKGDQLECQLITEYGSAHTVEMDQLSKTIRETGTLGITESNQTDLDEEEDLFGTNTLSYEQHALQSKPEKEDVLLSKKLILQGNTHQCICESCGHPLDLKSGKIKRNEHSLASDSSPKRLTQHIHLDTRNYGSIPTHRLSEHSKHKGVDFSGSRKLSGDRYRLPRSLSGPEFLNIQGALGETESPDLSPEEVKQPPSHQALAPTLNDSNQYHAFFLFHMCEESTVKRVVNRLEEPSLNFRCIWKSGDFRAGLSNVQRILYGVSKSRKTVIIMCQHFHQYLLPACEVVISQLLPASLTRSLLLIKTADVHVPHILRNVHCLDTADPRWWTFLLARLILPDVSSKSPPALQGYKPAELRNCHLLTSIRSTFKPCCAELADPAQVPSELAAHGIQILPKDLARVKHGLTSPAHFRCYLCSHNFAVLILAHAILLTTCLALVPMFEVHIKLAQPHDHWGYIHGALVWLCLLTLHITLAFVLRRKIKQATKITLAQVNGFLLRYKLLATIEHLTVTECNKYYSFVQEVMSNFTTDRLEMGNQSFSQSQSDQEYVLHAGHQSNVSIQMRAERLLLLHSSEYLNLLIRKRLRPPNSVRHVTIKCLPCLCQFLEHKILNANNKRGTDVV